MTQVTQKEKTKRREKGKMNIFDALAIIITVVVGTGIIGLLFCWLIEWKEPKPIYPARRFETVEEELEFEAQFYF